MANYRIKHPILGWVDLVNPRLKLANGSYAALNITPRWIPPSGGTAPAPDGFVLNTTRPSRANTGITPGTALTTLSPALAAQYGTVQAATSSACAKWIPDAGVTLDGFIIPWPVQNTQAGVTLRNCLLNGPQDITGGIATDTRNNPNLGVVASHAAGSSILLDRCDVIPSIVWSGSTGIIGHHYEARRCYIRDVTDAFGAYNINGTVAGVKGYGNFAERLTFFNNDPRQTNGITHNDFVQMQGGSDHDWQGNFFKGTWSPRADIPAGSSTLDPMGSGDTIANAAGGGARLFTGTPNVNALSNINISYNWGLGGITYSLVIPASGQSSSPGLGNFANNRDYGYHRVVSLGGFTEQVGIAHHADMPWNSDWAGKTVGARYLDTTHGNQLFDNFNDANGTQSMIRVQNS